MPYLGLPIRVNCMGHSSNGLVFVEREFDMEILFYICASTVLLLIGGVIAVFLTTSEEEKEEAGYTRKPHSVSASKFKPGDRLHTVNFIKIDGSVRQFDNFIVVEVCGRCVIGWEIPNGGQPKKRSFNIDRLLFCCHK